MHTLDLEVLFQQLLHYRDKTADLSTLEPWLQHQIMAASFPNLNHIPFTATTYIRNWIAKESLSHGQDFEALIMCWDQQVKTSIHGHPAFSFYHVISGVFEIELFSIESKNRLQLKETRRLHSSDTTWFSGQYGRYDNFLHRVTCLEAGCTFNVYSEDAQKGISPS